MDHYPMPEFPRRTEPDHCLSCGKATPRYLDREQAPLMGPYAGNGDVVRQERMETYERYLADWDPEKWFDPDSVEVWSRLRIRRHRDVYVWDGKSYRENPYGSFCTLRCAWTFAEGAATAGYRRT